MRPKISVNNAVSDNLGIRRSKFGIISIRPVGRISGHAPVIPVRLIRISADKNPVRGAAGIKSNAFSASVYPVFISVKIFFRLDNKVILTGNRRFIDRFFKNDFSFFSVNGKIDTLCFLLPVTVFVTDKRLYPSLGKIGF